MHGNRFISVLMWLWLAVMAVAALSCTKEIEETGTDPQEKPDFRPTSEVSVEVNILDPDASKKTKVDTEPDWGEYDETSSEKAINNLYLFAVDYNPATGEERVEGYVLIDLDKSVKTQNGYRAGHTFKLASGIKRFYVGANMTEQHVMAFINHAAINGGSYEEALSLVMDNYQTKTGAGTSMVMLSSPAYNGTQTEFDAATTKYLSLNAKLKRLASKVMVVADYSGSIFGPSNRPGERIYYIETAEGFFFDFQFVLNNTNKKFNVDERFKPGVALFNADPNWALGQWVEKDPATGSYRPKTMADYEGNFSFWDKDGIKERLDTTKWWCIKVPSSKSDYMGQGLYCLENTVYDDPEYGLTFSSAAEKSDAAYLTTTHVYIKARFAPKAVYGDSAPGINNTTDRISHLSWNYDKNGNNPYTFYVENGSDPKKFYTTTGIKNFGSSDYSKFTEYTGGWVYFKTFFEEGGMDDEDGVITYYGIDRWGIRRNDYCILTIRSIDSWGSNEPGSESIKVKSETVSNWTNRGYQEIIVNPVK